MRRRCRSTCYLGILKSICWYLLILFLYLIDHSFPWKFHILRSGSAAKHWHVAVANDLWILAKSKCIDGAGSLTTVYSKPPVLGIKPKLQWDEIDLVAHPFIHAQLLPQDTRFRFDMLEKKGDVTRVQLPHPEILEALTPGKQLLLCSIESAMVANWKLVSLCPCASGCLGWSCQVHLIQLIKIHPWFKM